jgi:uncharacterized protein (UPF0218 family)
VAASSVAPIVTTIAAPCVLATNGDPSADDVPNLRTGVLVAVFDRRQRREVPLDRGREIVVRVGLHDA